MKAITDVDYGAIYKDLGLNTDLAKAFGLQKSVIKAEAEQLADGLADYSEAQVTQAIVHTRQDLVLLVSHVAALNQKQSQLIRRLNGLIVLLACIAFALIWRLVW